MDPAHLSPLHQSFLCASQPVNQMSLTIDESPYFSYDYSKFGFDYFILFGFTKQVILHVGAWQPWVSAVNYMMRIAPVMYWAFQAFPLSWFVEKSHTTLALT
ncbi:hypothetical protein DSO57_1021529 [Entomophthora muscae]|uniref:Uncharacterized protein n=1 Tax=Entomophthora muscae TaxID=34485 RepID=A0ACC2SG09_9FUNG|nr:hypothetical protein DSO57_1021529 [Entomophthora muscae]